jgi:hypothetical protein
LVVKSFASSLINVGGTNGEDLGGIGDAYKIGLTRSFVLLAPLGSEFSLSLFLLEIHGHLCDESILFRQRASIGVGTGGHHRGRGRRAREDRDSLSHGVTNARTFDSSITLEESVPARFTR